MEIELKWIDGVHFEAADENGHRVPMDGPPEAGGQNLGTRPMQLILMGLAGCTAYDVIEILRKGRQQVEGLEVCLRGSRALDVPAVFEAIDIHFILRGKGLNPQGVDRAVSLSAEKYCSASIMLARAGVQISHSYEIFDATEA